MNKEAVKSPGEFFNEDCIEGSKRHLPDNSVDLIITDPPYGIQGDTLHKHYNRKEEFVLDGYVEVPAAQYAEFSRKWIEQAERVLRPGGSIYIVSGYTNLIHILEGLRATRLEEVNHIIWKYNFGVYTSRKYISSHYHILYYVKPGGRSTFNTHCRYGASEKAEGNGSLNYQDREDVWVINREYKPGKTKNKNELPHQLLIKILQYSSNPGDLACDFFLGSFSTAKAAIGLGRRATGFEISAAAFGHQIERISRIRPGFLLASLREPIGSAPKNQNKPWSAEEKEHIWQEYRLLLRKHGSKKKAVSELCEKAGRGNWSIVKLLAEMGDREESAAGVQDMFAGPF
jgi:site-specific DNA-methyltransferase (adenine-specific)